MPRMPHRLGLAAALLGAGAARAASVAPPSPTELMASISAAIVAAAGGGGGGFTVPPGDYPFWSDYPSQIALAAPTNFALTADGATFWLRPGQGLVISNATNLTLRGLTIDFPPQALHFTQGTVANVTTSPGDVVTFDMTMDAGYPDLDDPYIKGVHAKVIFWDAATRTMEHWQVQTTTSVHAATKLRAGVWRVSTVISGPTAGHKPEEGCLVTVSPVMEPAIQCSNCTGNLLEDVTLYGSSAMGYVETGGGGGSVLRRWRATRQPGSNRLLCTTLDGVHSTSVAAGLTLVDSEVAYAADDLFAVHCELGVAWGAAPPSSGAAGADHGAGAPTSSLYIIDTGGDAGRTVARAQPGDVLHFFALNETMEPLASATVAAVAVVDNATLQADAARASEDIKAQLHITVRPLEGATQLLRFDFTAPLPPGVAPRFSSLVQFDGRCGAGTLVRNCSLHDTTGGMRLKGAGVTVDGVAISRAYGMRMLPEVFWTQSVSRDITIQNCVFNVTGGAPAAPESIEYAPATCPGLVLSNNTFINAP